MAKRRSSTKNWVRKQASDPFVKQRDAQGYRSRAAFKLKEILARDRLIRRGDSVLDMGASPGGWTQVAIAAVGPAGRVVAVDILPMEPVPGTSFIEGDCRDADTLHKIRTEFGDQPVDLVISDIAPNITGIRDADEANVLALAEVVRATGLELLAPGGAMLMKLFQFPGTDPFVRDLKNSFSSIARRKPDSSRSTSREIYVVAKGFSI